MRDNFIRKSRLIHGDKYDYSLVEYIRSDIKVKIKFNNIIYEQIPTSHLLGKCPENLNSKLTTDTFISKARIIHGDKYDYSLVDYINSSTKVKIIFNGITYEQKPEGHLIGKCPECMVKKSNTYDFIKKSKLIHDDKYDYSLVNYINNSTKVKIILNDIIYEQTPAKHLSGKCPELVRNKKINFIERSKIIHGDKYDYSLVNYNGIEDKVKIIYNNEVYDVLPYSHLLGKNVEKIIVKNTDDFIKKSKLIHGDKYDYSKVKYVNSDTKVKLIFNNKEFLYSPTEHLKGGNPKGTSNGSRGEEKIKNILEKYNIDYISEFTFYDCRYINKLPFDFYIPNLNILIEYDGEHHFKEIGHYSKEHFNNTLRNDIIKNNYALNNKISLLRIPYTDYNNIENIINNFIKNQKSNCQGNQILTK
jgi:very-short-patch-repair endonuclease